jgi:uncharacterized membrane protein YeaQ/YmgE (transglycosylase-associated protein family)
MADDNPYKIDTPSAGKQFLVSLFFGVVGAAIAYVVTTKLSTPDQQVGSRQTQSAYKFVFYVTALVGGLVLIITMKIYKAWADKKYRESLDPPKAQVVRKD